MHVLELKIPPAVVGGVVVFLMWMASRWAAAWDVKIPWRVPVAASLVLLGAMVAISAIFAFRRAHTTVNPTKPGAASSLVVSGIYGRTRNPMYLGFAAVLLAVAVYLSNALALLLVPLFAAYLTRFQILPEERVLGALFPDEFASYKARVRRWF